MDRVLPRLSVLGFLGCIGLFVTSLVMEHYWQLSPCILCLLQRGVLLLLAPVFLLALGLAWFFSALGVFVRDIAQLGGFLGLALLYASGVFYSADKAREAAPAIWTLLKWNPLIHVIDGLRKVTLWGLEPDLRTLGYTWVCGILAFLFGAWFFHRLRPAFADVV